MSWTEDFSGLTATLGAPGAVDYARGAIIGAGISAGASANSVLRALRSAGIGFRRESFLETWAGLKAQAEINQTANALPVDSATGQLLPGTPPENWTGQYVHQVTATFRTRLTDGTYEISQRPMGIVDTQPLTPFEAAQATMNILETPVTDEDEDRYPRAADVLSLTLTGAWYRTTRGGG